MRERERETPQKVAEIRYRKQGMPTRRTITLPDSKVRSPQQTKG